MTRAAPWTLLCVLWAACGGGGSGPPSVAVIASQLPAGTASLHVSATLNGVASSSIQPITDLTHPFALDLPLGSKGTLAVTIDAWSSGTAIIGTGMGSIAVPAAGQVVLTVPMMAQAPVGVTLTGVTPGRGLDQGGASITLTGSLFQQGATVNFVGLKGSQPVVAQGTGVTVVSATQITLLTPVWTGNPGKVTVQVQNPDGQMATKAGGYYYVPYALSYSATNYTVGGGSLHVAVADFSGDGRPDLAVSSASLGQVQMLINQGEGVFGILQGSPLSVCAGLTPVPAIDVFAGPLTTAEKTRIDLVVRCGTQRLDTILSPLLTRTSTAAVSFPTTAPLTSMAVNDLNGDGAVDVAVTSLGNTGSGVLLNTGKGTFPTGAGLAPAYSEALPGNLGPVASGAIFHSGEGDLMIQSVNDMELDLHQDDSVMTTASFPIVKSITYASSNNIQSLLLADLENNGVLDALVVASTSNATTLVPTSFLNLNGTIKTVDAACRPTLAATQMVLGDLDGDGIPDLLSGRNDDESVLIFPGNGDGTFITTPTVIPTPGQAQGVAIADVNGDGRPDLIVTDVSPAHSQVSVLLNVN